MKHILGGSLALLLGLAAAAAQSDGPKKPATPAEQYRAILKEYQVAASGGDGTDEGRKKVIAQVDKLRDGIAQKFLDLAKKNPADPIAVDALTQAIWMVNYNSFPSGGKESPGSKAMTLLLRDHVPSDKLGPICLRITLGFRAEHEVFLRTILEKNPHKYAQALACLGLAQFLNNRMQRLDQIKEQPELAREYESRFGKDLLKELQRQDRAAVAKEIEALFERAGAEYGNEKIPFDGTVGAKVKAELFEFRHLQVGKAAPDIEGEDQDGKRFKLSDYRGKVILIDFWNEF
jgi:AhpC/TSA family